MARNHHEAAMQYCHDVLDGTVSACEWVKLACARQLDDLERWKDPGSPFSFVPVLGNRICNFIELLPHVKGPLAGQPIKLDPFQQFILTTAFGWVNQQGTRRFRRVYIEMPRGNAKSTLSSGVGLYGLTSDGEGGAQIFCAAKTRDQAKLIYDDAAAMARMAPGFCEHHGVDVGKQSISVEDTNSKFVALASEAHSLDGLNIHIGLIDELHVHKTRDVYDAIETGCGKRDQSLLWCITTAGVDRGGICYEIHSYLKRVLQGQIQDDGMFGVIYTIDQDDDWKTEAALQKANPSWGGAVRPDMVLDLQQKAIAVSSATNNFLTKHLNVWCNAATSFFNMKDWDAAKAPIQMEALAGRSCIVGMDLASKKDIASLVFLFEVDGELQIFCRHYLPDATVQDGRNSQYEGWARDGHLIATPGNVTDYTQILDDLLELAKIYDISEVVFDPFQATMLVNILTENGFNMVEMRPTVLNFSEPMKQVDAVLTDGKLKYDGDPVLYWMASNVVAHLDAKDNVYPRKSLPENKIDGIVALIMCMARHMKGAEKAKKVRSVYEDL